MPKIAPSAISPVSRMTLGPSAAMNNGTGGQSHRNRIDVPRNVAVSACTRSRNARQYSAQLVDLRASQADVDERVVAGADAEHHPSSAELLQGAEPTRGDRWVPGRRVADRRAQTHALGRVRHRRHRHERLGEDVLAVAVAEQLVARGFTELGPLDVLGDAPAHRGNAEPQPAHAGTERIKNPRGPGAARRARREALPSSSRCRPLRVREANRRR